MDLSHPEYAVLGESRARVLLRLFMLTESASGRYIHELSGNASLRTTQRILDELVDVGMVRVRRVGAANAYRANREHVLWGPIESLFAIRAVVEARIAEIIESALRPWMISALLYGSMARGEAGADSDIDVIVVWAAAGDDEHPQLALADAAEQIRLLTGNHAQLLAVSPEELRMLVDADDPLVESLRQDARPLTGAVVDLTKGRRG
jgi:predicted nucleotidyltransferase